MAISSISSIPSKNNSNNNSSSQQPITGSDGHSGNNDLSGKDGRSNGEDRSGKDNHPADQTSHLLSVADTILAILWEMGEGMVKSFSAHPYAHAFCHHKNRATFHTSVARLRRKGLMEKHKKGGVFTLTGKGKKAARFAFINAESSLYKPPSRAWDGGWRIIIFDVPEKYRAQRDYLRSIIKRMGFKELQRSVWAYPHPVPGFLRELLWEENIKPYTRFITTDSIDYDEDIRTLFPEVFFKEQMGKGSDK